MKRLVILFVFVITFLEVNSQNKIRGYEYWFNNNYSNKVENYISPTSNALINLNASTINLSEGVNILNFRVWDDSLKYSSTLSHFFYKTPSNISGSAQKNIVSYEYWFDNDYSNKVITPISNGESVTINSLIQTQNLSQGAHLINIRFKDDNNLYSSTLSQFFYKNNNLSFSNNVITSYKYWLDNNILDATNINLSSPVKDYILVDNIDLTRINKGEHTISFQFKDSLGFWSAVSTDTITKISLPIAEFSETINAECDHTTITFNNSSIDGDIYYWDFGNGDTSTLLNPQYSYFTSGTYLVSLTVSDTALNIDSTISKSFIINNRNTYSNLLISECDSYTSPSGKIFTISGIYSDTIPNTIGCDSLITIDLSINPTYNFHDTINLCKGESYTFHDGYIENNITSNISHISNLQSVNSCDSIITTYVRVTIIDNSVIQDSNSLISNQDGATYRWLNCDSNYSFIAGGTNKLFIAQHNGNYAVEINYNGCIDTSDCYHIIISSLIDIELTNNILIYPNPTNNILNIDLKGNTANKLIILDINGREIKEYKLNKDETQIDLSNLINGAYIIRVYDKKEMIYQSQVIKVD